MKNKPEIKYYQSKYGLLPGSSLGEIASSARRVYNDAIGKSRRKPGVNSKCKFFKTPRVFLDLYWPHLNQKTAKERFRRIGLYKCALDTIRNSRVEPAVSKSGDGKSVYYRFYGKSKEGVKFCVQVKEERKTGQKYFMSVYPSRKK